MTEHVDLLSEPMTPDEEAFHEWLCRTARFSRTGMWGTVARKTIIALRSDAARSADYPGKRWVPVETAIGIAHSSVGDLRDREDVIAKLREVAATPDNAGGSEPDEAAMTAFYTSPASPAEAASGRVRLWSDLTEAERDHWRAIATPARSDAGDGLDVDDMFDALVAEHLIFPATDNPEFIERIQKPIAARVLARLAKDPTDE